MSRNEHDDDCPGCRPVLIDARTGEVFSEDSQPMCIIAQFWKATTLKERKAFHEVTCQNSRDPKVLAILEPAMQRLQKMLNDATTH